MKQVFTFLLSFLICTSTFAQQETLNTLKEELKTATGNAKVDILHKIALEYMDKKVTVITKEVNGKVVSRTKSVDYPDANAAKKYIDDAMQLSKTNNYQDGLAASHYFKAKYYIAKDKDQKAQNEYQNWMKIRKEQDDVKKIRWAYFTSIEYFLSIKEFKLAWELYEELEKIVKSQTLTPYKELEFRVAQHYVLYSFSDYDNPKVYHKHIKVLEEIALHLLEYPNLITTTPYATLDYFFSAQIERALSKEQFETANELGKDWLASLERVADKEKQYKTARFIARYFFEKTFHTNGATDFMIAFLEKSIFYAKANGIDHKIKGAYYNACFCIRTSGQKIKALQLLMSGKDYFLNEYQNPEDVYVGALKSCSNSLYYETDSIRNQAIKMLDNWKKTLNASDEASLINYCNDYIQQLDR